MERREREWIKIELVVVQHRLCVLQVGRQLLNLLLPCGFVHHWFVGLRQICNILRLHLVLLVGWELVVVLPFVRCDH